MSYTIIFKKTPEKYLSKLSGKMYASIVCIIDALANNPRPAGCTEVKPYANVYKFVKEATVLCTKCKMIY